MVCGEMENFMVPDYVARELIYNVNSPQNVTVTCQYGLLMVNPPHPSALAQTNANLGKDSNVNYSITVH